MKPERFRGLDRGGAAPTTRAEYTVRSSLAPCKARFRLQIEHDRVYEPYALAFAFFLVAPIDTTLAYVVLFGGTFLVGVGEAIYAPTADALPAALAPAHLRGRYAALHQMAWGMSETITPALVALALASGDYARWLILAALGPLPPVPIGPWSGRRGGVTESPGRSCGRPSRPRRVVPNWR